MIIQQKVEHFEIKDLGFRTQIVGNRNMAGSASIVYIEDGTATIALYRANLEDIMKVFIDGGGCRLEQSINFEGSDAISEAIKLIKKFRSRWALLKDGQTIIVGRYGTPGSATAMETDTSVRIFIHSAPLETIKRENCPEYVRSVTIDRYNWNILDVINAIEEAIQDGLI